MTATLQQDATTGIEGVTRSVGRLIGSSFKLTETAADIMERELALVIRLSQRVRDEVISAETLEKARQQPIPARFREDAHAMVDLVADAGALLFQSYTSFICALTNSADYGASQDAKIIVQE